MSTVAEPDQSNTMPEPEQLRQLLSAAGDALRLAVLQVLGQSSFGVLELCEICATKQSGMSHHLKVLAQAGLVENRREGNAVFYRRCLPVDALHTALLERIDALPPEADVAARLDEVQRRRAEQSRAWFERFADERDFAGELIADYPQYAEIAAQLLDRALPESPGLAIEIGPGEGEFLLELAARCVRVVGYDNAAAVLKRARSRVDDARLRNVNLVEGEWPAAAPDQAEADVAVLNMVLHHMPSPADALRAAAWRLKPGGVLLVTELCRHDQHWAHESCGDLWLGFDEHELLAWAKRAGLAQLEAQFIAQRNGFQVQVRTFERTSLTS